MCDLSFVSDLITTLQMSGLALGACANGQLSDLVGRKKSFFLAFTFMVVFGSLSAAANSWQIYAACRFLVGVGYGGFMVVACVYPLEFVGHKWRVLCGTIGFWAVGIILLAPMVG